MRNFSSASTKLLFFLFLLQTSIASKEKQIKKLLGRNDSEKWNDLFLWMDENHGPQIKPLLKRAMRETAENVDVTITDPVRGGSPLMLAVEIDDTNAILTLIKRGTDVNQQNTHVRWSALHFAARNGSIKACSILLENGANIDAVSHSRRTPLMQAAYSREKNVYDFLIQKGADQTLTEADGRTASQILDR
jgi:ankyrin repeat protein